MEWLWQDYKICLTFLRSCLKTRKIVTPASGWLSGRHLADRLAPYQIKFERCAGGTRRTTAGEDAGATSDERVFKQLLKIFF
jgi:hypothetical protein